ncbi:hypothetical protein [Actibacterium sp. XHP0104]|uniref:hypothetical protein n=1 Tax=Actibacterium sp. XHP0104 TaxID=2984335 RepID=UPI0021E828BA|nr:hypothetical protein [Actibacterium sp. XHP0104]MCV2882138.1 hypothetical protein [Actibacterium sp. XHP0104]
MTDSDKKTQPEDADAVAEGKDAVTEQTAEPDPAPEAMSEVEEAEIVEDADHEPSEDTDTEETAEAEDSAPDEPPAPIVTPQPQAESSGSGGGFLATALGGVVAAAIGFGVAQFLGPDLMGSGSDEAVKAQAAEIAALEKRLNGLEAAPAPAPQSDEAMAAIAQLQTAISAEIETVSTRISDIDAQVSALSDRLTEVEARPAVIGGGDGVAAAAYDQELAAMRTALDEQRARNEALAAEVEQAASAASAELNAATENARALEQSAAMMRIHASLETGGGFAGALSAFDGAAISPALAQAAQDGVPTVAQLQASYVPSAREALAASRKAQMGDSATDRLGSFLRSQVGARSLTPREGADPDAVLSRAEAAVSTGDLATALAEIATLPEAGQAAMADWVAQAQLRLDALTGAQALAASLN